MEDLSAHILLLFVPMALGNSLHMWVVKKNYFSSLAMPISVELYGKNKTYRAFVVLPFFSGVLAMIGSLSLDQAYSGSLISDSFLGFTMGIVYLLFELPNSFIKRRLGIANGQHSKKHKWLQVLVDRADSLVGIFLLYYLCTPISAIDSLKLFFWAMFISYAISFLLVRLKIKKSV